MRHDLSYATGYESEWDKFMTEVNSEYEVAQKWSSMTGRVEKLGDAIRERTVAAGRRAGADVGGTGQSGFAVDALVLARSSINAAASAAAAAFRPREAEGRPNMILAEAGTGAGKTPGYLAPASLWSEINDGPVWIATYTRNLQRQIDDELTRLDSVVPPESANVTLPAAGSSE